MIYKFALEEGRSYDVRHDSETGELPNFVSVSDSAVVAPSNEVSKPNPNDPCLCGAVWIEGEFAGQRKKYKHCCGKTSN